MLLDKYGPSFFTRLNALEPRRYSSGAPAIQALAAGEGAIHFPAISAQVTDAQAKGAPVAMVPQSVTTGTLYFVAMTTRSKAKHPNAARLFANYVLSPDGNKVFNDDPGVVGIYDTKGLPSGFEFPKLGAAARVAEIGKLLGFE